MPKVPKAPRQARGQKSLAKPGVVKTSSLSGECAKYVDASSAVLKDLARAFLAKFPSFTIVGAQTPDEIQIAMEQKIARRRHDKRKAQEDTFIDTRVNAPLGEVVTAFLAQYPKDAKGHKNLATGVEFRIKMRRQRQKVQERCRSQQAAAVARVDGHARQAACARRAVSDKLREEHTAAVSAFGAQCSTLADNVLLVEIRGAGWRDDYRTVARMESIAQAMMSSLAVKFGEGQGMLHQCDSADLPTLQSAIGICARTLGELLDAFPAADEADAHKKLLGLARDHVHQGAESRLDDLTSFNPRVSLKQASRSNTFAQFVRPQKSFKERFQTVAEKLRAVVGLRMRVLPAVGLVDQGVEMTPVTVLAEDLGALEADISAQIDTLSVRLRQWKFTIADRKQNLFALAGRSSRTANLQDPQPIAHVLVADGGATNNSSVSITVGPSLHEMSVSTSWMERIHTSAFGGLLCRKEPPVP